MKTMPIGAFPVFILLASASYFKVCEKLPVADKHMTIKNFHFFGAEIIESFFS